MRVGPFVLLWVLTFTGNEAQLDVCGTAPLKVASESRIIGGQDAAAGSWPWQPSQAAYFLSSASDVTVFLGRDTQEGPNPHEVSRSASLVIKHPNFDEKTKENDVALLRLSSPVQLSDHIRPVCLAADRSFFPDGLSTWITGWGDIQTGAFLPSPQRLQEVKVPIVSHIQCDAAYGFITTSMICAGPDVRGQGFCEKDLGGPLVTLNGSRWVQAGVASFAQGCGYPDFPGVYTRVSAYQSWISSQVSDPDPGPGFITFYCSGAAKDNVLRLSSLASVLLALWIPS
ncbi:tryptase-like [Cololabis saira]|uniref:tryptase-like n=1 Tax=Cololabis saira TaxID=129043 RepID=UPI002AD2355C|nr:tryptase-like [Cololabis saira]